MSRKFISAVLAASITVTGLSVQTADAGNRDLERFLVGATALLIIGAAVSNNNANQQQPAQHNKPHDHDNNRYNDHNNNRHVKPRPLPQRVSRKLLPAQCERTAFTRQGQLQVVAARCLQRNYRDANALPQQCAGNFQMNNRKGNVGYAYAKRCLAKFGYRMNRG